MKRRFSKVLAYAILFSTLFQLGICERVFAYTPEAIAIDVENGDFSENNVGGDGANTLLWKRGSANTTGGVLRVAPNSGGGGTTVKRNQVQLTDGFSTYFQIQLHDHLSGGADGIAFVLYKADEPILGDYGEGLGYKNINNSICVEFDTYYNGINLSEGVTPHAAIMVNGNNNHAGQPEGSKVGYDAIKTQIINAWVDYNEGTITATFGTSETRDDDANVTITRNVSSAVSLVGENVFVGFSASTGASLSNHDVLKWYFKNSYEQGGLSSSADTYSQAPATVSVAPDTSTNPTKADIAIKDGSGDDLVGETFDVYIDNNQLQGDYITVAEEVYNSIPIPTNLINGSHTIRVVGEGGVTNFAEFTVAKYTATASADTLTPVVGVDDPITLTVKNALEETDTNFDGAKDVTITGVEAAPDSTYGSFNGTVLDENSAGAGQVISVTFTDGVATPNLKLNKADEQTLGFSIATVTTPATDTLTITPTHGTAASMTVTQNITAPESNGGNFAQQPSITLKDAYGNTCTGDNATAVAAAKEDAGTWTLTGTTTATASSGVATFTNLGATNTALVNNAQLGFISTGLDKVTSATVNLPAPVVSGGRSSGSSNKIATPNQAAVIVIVNGKEQNAGKEFKTTEAGKSKITVEVNSEVIESKIEEAIKNNTKGTGNVIQVPVVDTTSEITEVELTGEIVKKLEENTFDVSVKRHNVEYIIPAEEFTITKAAESLGVLEKDLKDIKIEIQITKLDETVVAKYNEVAKANSAELVFPPMKFEVAAKTIKSNGATNIVEIGMFSKYVERVMEIPAGVNPSKITTGIVFNADGTYSHVPTEVFQKDGKWYTKLNSLTNSNYSVIWNPITVKSVEEHWSKDAVNDMASRLVIFNPETFAPDKAITRADFTEYIVRALGLYREKSISESKFKDVSINGDRTLAIMIASEYGIVEGYPDETFRPEALITREEAMTMYQSAMMITKLVGTDNERYLSYSDYNQVGSWAISNVKAVLSAHTFNGTTSTTISPKANLTYAEAAQAIKNLLVESKLINK